MEVHEKLYWDAKHRNDDWYKYQTEVNPEYSWNKHPLTLTGYNLTGFNMTQSNVIARMCGSNLQYHFHLDKLPNRFQRYMLKKVFAIELTVKP